MWANIDADDSDYEAFALGARRQADLARVAESHGLVVESWREKGYLQMYVEGPEDQVVEVLRSLRSGGHDPFYADVPDEHTLERVWRLYGPGEGGESLLYSVEIDPF